MSSKRFAVLGDPIIHSLSPRIHSAAYKALGIDWTYEAKQVAKGSLAEFLDASNADGYSVTMPLKYEAAALADLRDPLVSLTGVANTLIRSDNGWTAFNTDVFGVTKALETTLKKPIEVVSLLGAGATAKSVMVAIAKAKPSVLFDIYVRNVDRAGDLIELAGDLNVFTSVHEMSEFSNFQELTVNTLPADATDAVPELKQNGYLLNVNYSGSDERFVSSFEPAKVTDGQTMLVWQALQQIRLFYGLGASDSLPSEQLVLQAMFEAL